MYKNLEKNNIFLKSLPLIIFIFSPKIDIISIPNFWQGIRIDDLIIFFYLIYFVLVNNFKIFPNLINKQTFALNWIIFFPYVILSMLIGKIFLLNPQWIIAVRYLEYMGLIIILNQIDPDKNKILLLFKIYIVINFIFVILQYFELIGGFTSRGNCDKVAHMKDIKSYCFDKEDIKSICFFSCNLGFMKNYVLPGGFLNNRVPGITGGVWELSTNISICIYALILFEKKINKILPFILMAMIMLIIAQSRGIIFGFIAGSIFLINDYKKAIKIILYSIIFVFLMYVLNFFNFKQIIQDRFLIDYISLIKIIFGSFSGTLPLKSEVSGTGLESMWLRAYTWGQSLSDLKKSNILTFFGSGGSLIYTESFLIRVITSFGILGTLIVIFFSRKLPWFFIVFVLVTGLTVDLFVSFKIFVFSFLLLFALNKHKLKHS